MEDRNGMCSTLRVLWTVTAGSLPRPLRYCAHCKRKRAFQSSGKFRLNAQGKRLDAWLIYLCSACGRRWNRPVIERRPISDLDPGLLRRLQNNCPDLATDIARQTPALPYAGQQDTERNSLRIKKQALPSDPSPWSMLEIDLVCPSPLKMRLDRFLADQLRLSRAQIKKLSDNSALQVLNIGNVGLRRPVATGTRIVLNLETLPEHEKLIQAALTAIPNSQEALLSHTKPR